MLINQWRFERGETSDLSRPPLAEHQPTRSVKSAFAVFIALAALQHAGILKKQSPSSADSQYYVIWEGLRVYQARRAF